MRTSTCFTFYESVNSLPVSLSEVDEDEDEDDTGDAESDFEEMRPDMNLATHDEGPSARDIEGQRRLGML